jgi:hypothetical protein
MNAEWVIQTNFFTLINNNNHELLQYIFAIPNGITSNPIAKKLAKQNGLLCGVCDVFVSIPNKKYHGLYIEFKTKTSRLSKEQEIFISNVKVKGYDVVIMRDCNEAYNYLIKYLGE